MKGPRPEPISMSRRLTVALAMAMTIVIVLVGGGFYLHTAYELDNTFNRKMEQTLSYLDGTLGPVLWNFDHETAARVAETVLRDDLVVGVTILDDKRNHIFSVLEESGESVLVRTMTIQFQGASVGEIELLFSRTSLTKALIDILWVSLSFWVLAVLCIAVLPGFFIRKWFRAPLAAFIELAKTYRQNPEISPVLETPILEFQPIEQVVRELASDVFRQLRELREREEHFRSIFENALYGIAVTGMDFKFLEVNDAWCKLIGYTEAELLGKMGIEDITLPEDFPESMAMIEKLIDGEIDQFILEKRYKAKSGAIINSMSFVKASYDDNGKFLRSTAAILDITDRKKSEAQLVQAQKMEAVGQLTGGVAHDFNNLLAIIVGNLEFLGDRFPKEDEASDLISKVIDAVERGSTLTQRLLAFSRKQALQPKSIDINALISDMEFLLRRTLMEGITIQLRTADNLWACEADPAQVESVVLNLAINARDAMPNGGNLSIETVNVVLSEEDAVEIEDVVPGEYVSLVVRDDGTGMSPEVKERVFDPFFTTKGMVGHSGLGLSMVYGFAKQSGGYVSIDSEEGRGAAIMVFLPRARQEVESSETRETTTPRTEIKGERILVVEDDPDVRAITKAQLENLGYKVLEAETAAAALEILSMSEVDLLLSDIILPGGMGGNELAKETRRLYPSVKILFMSGYSEGGAQSSAGLQNGGTLIQKPFRQKELAQKISNLFEEVSEH
jgi:PAS domain S-box-containing protein